MRQEQVQQISTVHSSGKKIRGKKSIIVQEWEHFRRHKELFFLSLPAIVFLFIFSYLTLIFLIIAFKDYHFDQGLFGSEWVGFKNFRFFFISNTALSVTRNTVLYNVAFILLTTVSALALAVMMNTVSRKWIKFHQTVLFLPYFLSWVVIGYIVLGFLDYENGIVNHLLAGIGREPVQWYFEGRYWPFILVVVQLWKSVGFSALIYFAGIMGIEPSYYEAATIDGASRWQMVTKITLPLLTPLIVILFIVSMGSIFRADFGLFYFVPNNSSLLYTATDVIDTYVYRALRVNGDMGMSAAVGLYQSVVGFVLVLTSNYVIKKTNEDHALW